MRTGRVLAFILLASLISMPALAQSKAESQESLNQRIERLDQRLETLEKQRTSELFTASPEAQELTKLRLEMHLPEPLGDSFTSLGPSASHAFASKSPLRFGLIGEARWMRSYDGVGFGTTGGSRTDLSRLLILMSSRFSRKLVASAALAAPETNALDTRATSLVRYAHLDLLWGNEAGVRVGNFLVPFGVHNLRFDPHLFPSVRAPMVEAALIPAPWNENGILLYARERNISLQGGYVTGFDINNATSNSWLRSARQAAYATSAKAESGAWIARAEWLANEDGVGGSVYIGEANQGDARMGRAEVRLWEFHAEVRAERFRARGLFAEGSLSDTEKILAATGRTLGKRARGAGVHLIYDALPRLAPLGRERTHPVPPDWQELPIFVSWEQFDPQVEVPDGTTPDTRARLDVMTYGFNYRPHPQVVFKFDTAFETNGARETTRVYEAGLGFVF